MRVKVRVSGHPAHELAPLGVSLSALALTQTLALTLAMALALTLALTLTLTAGNPNPSHLADELRADVLLLVGELDRLRDRHAVLGDLGRAEGLLDNDVAPLRPERHLRGASTSGYG